MTSESAPVALRLAMPRLPSEPEEDELDELPPIDGDGGDEARTGRDLDEIGGPETNDPGEALARRLDGRGRAGRRGGARRPRRGRGRGRVARRSLSILRTSTSARPRSSTRARRRRRWRTARSRSAPDEDFGIGEGAERSRLDFAEEGPVNADEELRDEDLPALDADDAPEEEGRTEDDGLLDERVIGEEPLGLPWAAHPWTRVGPPLGLSSVGLPGRDHGHGVRGSRRARVGSRGVGGARADSRGPRGRSASFARRRACTGVASRPSPPTARRWLAVVEGGRLLLSHDGGGDSKRSPMPEGVAAARRGARVGRPLGADADREPSLRASRKAPRAMRGARAASCRWRRTAPAGWWRWRSTRRAGPPLSSAGNGSGTVGLRGRSGAGRPSSGRGSAPARTMWPTCSPRLAGASSSVGSERQLESPFLGGTGHRAGDRRRRSGPWSRPRTPRPTTRPASFASMARGRIARRPPGPGARRRRGRRADAGPGLR